MGVENAVQVVVAFEGPATTIPVGRLSVKVKTSAGDGLSVLSMLTVNVLRLPTQGDRARREALAKSWPIAGYRQVGAGRTAVAGARGQVAGYVGVGTFSGHAASHVDRHGAGLANSELAIAEGDGAAAVWRAEDGIGAVGRGVCRVSDSDLHRQGIGKCQVCQRSRVVVDNSERQRTDAPRPDGVWSKDLGKRRLSLGRRCEYQYWEKLKKTNP